jgi:hypothetical protein
MCCHVGQSGPAAGLEFQEGEEGDVEKAAGEVVLMRSAFDNTTS